MVPDTENEKKVSLDAMAMITPCHAEKLHTKSIDSSVVGINSSSAYAEQYVVSPPCAGPLATNVTHIPSRVRVPASAVVKRVDTKDPMVTPPPFQIPLFGRWEGCLEEFCNVVDFSSQELAAGEIVELQCRKQSGIILHRFLLMRLRVPENGDGMKRNVWLRLDRRADPTAGIAGLVIAGGATQANDCVKLAIDESRVLHGPPSTIEETYTFKQTRPVLKDLILFLRICCEELIRYCVWPDNCWFFCSLVTEHLAHQCPEDINIKQLQNINLATKIRRHIGIRYHIDSGQSVNELPYSDQLLYLLSAAKGQIAVGTKESARHLIKLDNAISNNPIAKNKKLMPWLYPLKLFRGIQSKQPLITVTLCETLHDVYHNQRKFSVFQELSRRFQDEATLRGLAPLPGSQATAHLADIGWKLVKYRLYLPAVEATNLMRSVERLARQLLDKAPSTYHQGLLHETLTAYGEELNQTAVTATKEHRRKMRDVFEDAVTLARHLNKEQPGVHLDSLADSLGSYCLSLAENEEFDKASIACKESIENWRLLYRKHCAERVENGCQSLEMQQVFRDWCWCYCTDDKPCDALTEVLLHADSTLNDTSPISLTDWETMYKMYGKFLEAASAAPEDCKTVVMGRHRR